VHFYRGQGTFPRTVKGQILGLGGGYAGGLPVGPHPLSETPTVGWIHQATSRRHAGGEKRVHNLPVECRSIH